MIYSNHGKFSFYNSKVVFDSTEGKQSQYTNDVKQYEDMVKTFSYRFSNLIVQEVQPTEEQKNRLEFVNASEAENKETWGDEVNLFVQHGAILESFNTAFLLAVKESYLSETESYLKRIKETKWNEIKLERDRRKYLGVKVGEHWFHSDDASRIQQLALVMMKDAIPVGMQWKTLTLTPESVFVEMTPSIAGGIFQATAVNDNAVFAAAEAHRTNMESSATPWDYDFSTGWPVSIGDAE